MEARRENFFVLLGFLAILSFAGPLRAQPVPSSAQEVYYPVWALEHHELTLIAASSLVAGNETVAVVDFYDDPATDRRVDYVEVRNHAGRLLAISWFDRFGIERVAADRGLVEGKNDLEGVFVMLLDGDPV